MLDRTTGKSLLTTPFATVNWASGIDARTADPPIPTKEPSRDGRLVAPDEGGGTNYRSPSYDPATGLFIVSARDAYGIYFFKEEHGKYGWAGADYGVHAKGGHSRHRPADGTGRAGTTTSAAAPAPAC